MKQAPVHPIVMQPVLDEKPWGSRRLAEVGITLPGIVRIGEALYTAPGATIADGKHAGLSLGELARMAPEAWVGARGLAVTRGQAIFPLLVKLIDANLDLSIQVHPNDIMAAAANLGTGKTEAWHVLAARDDSVLYAGLALSADAEEFARACARADGSSAKFLRQIPARPGTTIVVPAGTPHAIGAGVLLYEIQQPSNVTFRLDDWGRVDERGTQRALHLDDGLAAVDPHSRPEPAPPLALTGTGPRRELIAATRFFALERFTLEMGERVLLAPLESPQVLSCLPGAGSLQCGDWRQTVTSGLTAVVPVGCPTAFLASQETVLLRGWAPDLERDVMAPAQAAGASPEEIARLGISAGG